MDYNSIYNYYNDQLQKILTPARYTHSMRVVQTSLKLAPKFDADYQKTALAALVHDRGKEIGVNQLIKIAEQAGLILDEAETSHPGLLHGPVGAYLLKQEGKINDEDILQAVRFHTTGRPGMSSIEKAVFLADLIEPGRDYPNVDILRKLSFNEPYLGLVKALDWTLEYLMRMGWVIHPLTVKTRNYYLQKRGTTRSLKI
ncbi:bis(5'-nucleosyl)-tetraphosphatase (symmetrical) YqeK [Natranaerobius thermophilus]|uniref:bis(5'-nucleosyl)-tetraphosphatase (symmetrical) n=1 Tax=Natranaerobius thermophilus (strain ATCC BAA-1301 / DSM 18059 / JW/NM-WN-LF) TaxID=457570 RepID=B2A6B9_NATTJ|nr:bis(5'-nucleosyl)-tetraphosphatase (symmetrical) YqeK [Natranaerobius thermophilus]ACB84130.1 metal dependent phosphohydrolase [Natranaerobius thermophilus JW/NM-WN-LF]